MVKNSTGTQKNNTGAKDALTPLMQQYQHIKARYPGIILFFRLGDFYEMFGEDAQKASPILDVVLTKRTHYPMCGVPYHSVNAYIRKLIKAGEKVAICEQLEEPKPGMGIVKRDVVRIITPGTLLEDNLLESKKNNYLVAIYPNDNFTLFGVASIDISTGEFKVTETNSATLKNELFALSPGEIIIPEQYRSHPFLLSFEKQTAIAVSPLESWLFAPEEAANKIQLFFKVHSVKAFGIENKQLALCAAGGALAYIDKTQPQTPNVAKPVFSGITYYSLEDYLLMDESALRTLDIVENQVTKTEENTLVETIDYTSTPMGARLLRQYIVRPLLSVSEIKNRQQAARYFVEEGLVRREIRTCLKDISDIERIMSRVASGSAGPRELLGLKTSLAALPLLRKHLEPGGPFIELPIRLKDIKQHIEIPSEIIALIERTLSDDPPITLKNGGIIREGFNASLDELRTIKREGKNILSQIEEKERKKTGINTLKIGYTSVFGYYLEVTKSYLAMVPQDFIRKQTLTNCERFITPELKIYEEKITTAEDKILKLEESLFKELLAAILGFSDILKLAAGAIAHLDLFAAFAELAVMHNYCLPTVDDSLEIDVKDGRHPVIEKKLQSGSFVPNDITLNGNAQHIILLTGPNMAGKSTYLRQTALVSILAQIGSYVPAAQARIGIVDRIFTRIGASDNLAAGESTFMVEMHETSHILHQFTERSLIILDEIGRGTSTYDGISIAWATIEYLAQKTDKKRPGPKVLFATHYFELTELDKKYEGIKNCNVEVKEWHDEVIFLHKIIPGSADRSYGIHVAQLAGLPKEVVKRAYAILAGLEKKSIDMTPGDRKPNSSQLDFFTTSFSQILIELEKLDINTLTPLEALKLLSEWKKRT